VPIIWKVKIPIRQKLLVALLLGSGLFIIAAAIMRCVTSIQHITHIDTAGVWAIRETFVTIIAINAPCIRPLFGGAKDPAGKAGFKMRDRPTGGDSYYGRGSESGSSQVKIVGECDEEEELGNRINVTTMVAVDNRHIEELTKEDAHAYLVAAGKGWEDGKR
jgi:hypothetical protein